MNFPWNIDLIDALIFGRRRLHLVSLSEQNTNLVLRSVEPYAISIILRPSRPAAFELKKGINKD